MAELGVGLVPYSPLGRGFLTVTPDRSTLGEKDFQRTNPRFAGEGARRARRARRSHRPCVKWRTGWVPRPRSSSPWTPRHWPRWTR
jgi:hypothetical protein